MCCGDVDQDGVDTVTGHRIAVGAIIEHLIVGRIPAVEVAGHVERLGDNSASSQRDDESQ
jgi:hypothetical protein